MANRINFQVGFQEDGSSLNKIKRDLQEIQQMARDVDFTSGLNPQELQSMTKAAHTLEAALDAAFDVDLNTVNIQKFNNLLKQTGLDIKDIQQGLAYAGTTGQSAFLNVTSSLMKFNTAAKQTNQFLNNIATSFANTVRWGAMSSIVNNISGTIQKSYYYVKDLDSALNDIRIVTGKSADEMARFATQANNAAKQLAVTTKDYTQGALIYYQQGLGDETVKTLTDITAMTSNVTQQSMSTVSEQLTAVWNGYQVANQAAQEGMQVYEEYVDKMAAVGAATASDLEELSTAMSKVASAASSMGVDFDDLNAQIATIVSVTRQAPESVGTALKTIYARLGDLKVDGVDEFGTKLGEVSSQLQTMGIDILDTNGDMRDMSDVIAEVAEKWQTWTSAQREAAAVAMAGKRQYNNLVALFDNWDMYGDALRTSMGAAGTLQEQQAIAMESLANKLDVLKATAEDVYDSLFDEDHLKSFADAGINILSILANVIDGLGGLDSILVMLGGTATRVFSEQIASGLATLTYNAQNAHNEITNMEQNYQQLQTMFSDSNFVMDEFGATAAGLKDSLDDLKSYYNDMYQYQNMMNESEKQQYNNIIEAKVQVGETGIELENQLQSWRRNTVAVKTFGASIANITDKNGFDKLNQQLLTFGNEVNKFENKLYEAGASFNSHEFGQAFGSLIGNLKNSGIEIDSIKTKYQEFSSNVRQGTMTSEEALANLIDYLHQLGISANNLTALQQKFTLLGEAAENMGIRMKQAMELKQAYTNVTRMIGAIGQLASGLMIISNIKNIIDNDDLTSGEKALQIITNLTMAITMLGSGLTGTLQGLKSLPTAFVGLVSSLTATVTAETSVGAAATAMWTEVLWPIAPIIAAIAGLSLLIYGLVKAWNADADAAKEAAAQAEKIKSNYNDVKNSYEELKASLEDYNDARKGLDELIKGTDEWNDAVQSLNEQVLELLDAYPKLAQYVSNNGGLLELSQEGQNQLLKAQQANVQTAYQSMLMANARANQTANKSAITDFARDTYVDYAGDGSVGYLYETSANKVVEALNSQGVNILENSDTLADAAKITKQEAEAVLRNKDAVLKLANTVEANTEANSIYAQQLGQSMISDTAYSGSQFAEQIAQMVGENALNKYLDTYADEYKDKLFGKRDKYIQKQYAKLMGYKWVDDLNGNKGKYMVGGEVTEIADEVARTALAQAAAQKTAAEETQEQVNALMSMVNTLSNGNTNVENAIANLAIHTADLSNLTQEEVEAVANSDLAKLSDDTLEALGFGSVDELIELRDKAVENWNDGIKSIAEGIVTKSAKEAFDSLDKSKYSLDTQKLIAKTLDRAYAYDKLDEAIEAINAGHVEDFAESLNHIADATVDFATNYADIHKIIDGLEQGDTISAEDYQTLGAEASSYFTQMLDGTYKLTADAQTFYSVVQQGLISQAHGQMASLKADNNTYSKISGYDFNTLSQTANYVNENGENKYNAEIVRQQIELIEKLGDQSEETKIQIKAWEDQLTNGSFESKQSLQDIADMVVSCKDAFDGLSDRIVANESAIKQMDFAIASSYDNFTDLKKALDDGTISLEAFNTAAVKLDAIKDIENLDSDELKEFSQYLKEIADDSEELADELGDNAAKVVAKGIMKMNDAIDTLANNWDDWSGILKESTDYSEEYSEAMQGMRSAMADLLDISEEFIDNSFIKDHLDDIKLAAEGDAEAIDRLRDALVEPIVAKIALENDIDADDLLAEVMNLQAMLDELGTLKVGTEVDDSSFINACNEMIAATGMTTQQINALFDAMGFEANFASEGQDVGGTYTLTTKHHEVIDKNIDENGVGTWTETEWAETEEVPYEGEATAFSMSTNGEVPKINSVTKKASGSSNNYSSSNKGGTKQPGGKSKSGGGSKGKERTAKDEKNFEDEFDRYWEIKKAIDAVDRALNKLNKDQENLYGYELINSLKQENKLLEQQAANYNALYAAQQQEAAELREQLGTMGVMFDASGAITNYAAATASALAAYNAAIQQYNAGLIDETTLGVYEKAYENFKKLLDRYNTLYYTEMKDTQEKLEDIQREIKANNLKAWEVEIEVKLDLREAERGWAKFLKEINEDFTKVYQDLRANMDELKKESKTYLGSSGTIGVDIKAIKDVVAEIDKMKAGGSSDMFESISQAQEKLKELNQQLQDDAKNMHDLWKQAWDTYLDGIDQVADKFEDLMEQFEHINDELEFQGELIELLYGEKAYGLLNTLYKGQEKSLENQIGSVKQQVDMWKKLWEESGATMDNQANWTEDQRKYYEQWMKAQDDLNDLVIEYIKLLKEDYLNTVNQVLDELEKSLTGSSLKDIQTEWERISANADKYLDSVEGAYEIQKLANKIDESIASTSNLKNQQKLQALRDKEIKYLREKENLTQYDLDAAEARYQIALKEMALEDARNNKTAMKLVRNEQGNWSYQYIADETEVMTKQQELLDAYNNLYQLASDAYEANLEALQELQEKYLESAREIYTDETLSEEEKEQKLLELREWYFEQYALLAEENTLYREDLATSAAGLLLEIYNQDEEAYRYMTDSERAMVDALVAANIEDYQDLCDKLKANYKDIGDASKDLMKDTRQDWTSSAQELANRWIESSDQIRKDVLDSHAQIQKATEDYKKKVDWCAEAVERNFSEQGITGAINKAADATDNLKDKTEDLVNDGVSYLAELKAAVDEIADAWRSVQAEIEAAISLLQQYMSEMASANAGGGGDSGTGGSGGGTGGSGGGTEKGWSDGDAMNIAGNIWYYGSWGNNPTRKALMIQKFGESNGSSLYNAVQSKFNSDRYGYSKPFPNDMNYYAGYGPSAYDTGGYTGTWDNTGRLAMLHQKELVLNADDTKNFLSGISMLRDMSSLNGSISNAIASAIGGMALRLGGLNAGTISGGSTSETTIGGDTFYVTAEFPNANDVNDIREALLSLPNLASQYVNRNQK